MTAISLGGRLWRVIDAQGVERIVSVTEANDNEEGAEAAVAQMLAPPAEVIEAMRLAARRAAMKCTRLQGRLALGETICATLDAMAANPATPWATREALNNSIEWSRTSPMIATLGAALGYSDAQMDALFDVAVTLQV